MPVHLGAPDPWPRGSRTKSHTIDSFYCINNWGERSRGSPSRGARTSKTSARGGHTNCNFIMASRLQFENSNEIGVFAKLTNSYALTCIGGSENFYSAFEAELADHIPVIHCSLADCRIIGRMSVGTPTQFARQRDIYYLTA
jgi:hypothetical protein